MYLYRNICKHIIFEVNIYVHSIFRNRRPVCFRSRIKTEWSVPPAFTAYQGFDALFHSTECYITKPANQEFLESIGLTESGVSRLIRAAYALLDLQTYFTAGPDEVRAWTFLRGTKAPQAAGIIHTDFEKGFIRAEVIKYDDFVTLGSETAVKEAGKMSVEGKEYVVQDGDIMHFRFNV